MREIKCLKCGEWNQDNLYCKACGAVIDTREELRLIIRENEIKESERPRDKFETTIHRWKSHRWWIVRAFYGVAYGTSLIFGLFAAFLAWLAALANA